ncbi:MAG: LON peptidase substrate-binding domain-containing protein [Elusimicrobia bacterium]|nr:LON peptidase substrate-binding domain-containing protein [Elusimicrobiota bacterium]
MTNLLSLFQDEILNSSMKNIPIFPLPGHVLLPGEPLPLHIFEERYKLLVEFALAQKRLMVLANLKPGLRKDGEEKNKIYDIAGLGRIVLDERMADGRFNLVLLGLKRIRIREIVQETPFQQAEIEILPETFPSIFFPQAQSLENEIYGLISQMGKLNNDHLEEDLSKMIKNFSYQDITLGALTDLVSAYLPLASKEKQMIMEETDMVKRAEKLIFELKFKIYSLKRGGSSSTLLN